MSEGWTFQERGWWTHKDGGIVRENDGWYVYPMRYSQSSCYGPFRKREDACKAAVVYFDLPEHREYDE